MMLVLMTLGLLVLLPAWHVLIRNQKRGATESVIIIGDDLEKISAINNNSEIDFIGYVSLNIRSQDGHKNPETTSESTPVATFTDGGTTSLVPQPEIDNLDYLGGLSRLHETLLSYDPDTAVLAFSQTDREEFFGVLNTCYNHGVTTKAHRELGDNILTCDTSKYEDLVDINLEPWDWQDRMIKRVFDMSFAATGLLVFSPLMIAIAIAIKVDSPGPIFYVQERTSAFGGTFSVYKFRTMIPETEDPTPIDDEENDRITRVGRILRDTHVDEIPQLWAIFTGKMSVVGPRAAWTDEEKELQKRVGDWQKRWFVKPGLTGLAQINEASSTNPKQKLGYDVEYIRRQSFPLDMQIIVKQVYKVINDALDYSA
ncbi:sugar transferase [Halocatena pleomorpha]